MLIPSIDLMGGKIVQLMQGSKKVLDFNDFDAWVERFAEFPLVQLIDLDAAMGTGSNHKLIEYFCARLRCQVGGGIRATDNVRALFDCGAEKVIVGSSLVKIPPGRPSTAAEIHIGFARELHELVGPDRLIFAVDTRGGHVAIHGWKTITALEPAMMMKQLEPFCSAFLYTNIDTEGLMQGIPLHRIRELRAQTVRRLIAAGGICSLSEIQALDEIGVDAVVGMAIYSGRLNISLVRNRN